MQHRHPHPLRSMFVEAYSFSKPIGEWDTSNVTDMRHMFDGAESFNLENAPWFHE